jgi:rhodanese-related sulfurtransferase
MIERLARGLWGRSRVAEVSPEQVRQWLTEGKRVQILDIRDEGAFQEGHLPGARHTPLARLEHVGSALDRAAPTVVY